MARSSRARSGGSSRRPQPKATSRKSAAAPVADVEIVEEKKGMGIDDGIPILTTVLLLVAILFVDYIRGAKFDGGLFF